MNSKKVIVGVACYLLIFMSQLIWAKDLGSPIQYLYMTNHTPWYSDNKGAYTVSNASEETGVAIRDKYYILAVDFNLLNKCNPDVSFFITKDKTLGPVQSNFKGSADSYALVVDGIYYRPRAEPIFAKYKNGIGLYGSFDIDANTLIQSKVITPVLDLGSGRVVTANFEKRKNKIKSLRSGLSKCRNGYAE